MRYIISISFVFAAVAVILAVSVMPHHHHDELFCVEAAEHTQDEDTEKSEDSGSCVAESEYVDLSGRREKCGVCHPAAYGHDGYTNLFPLICLYLSEILPDLPVVETDYGEYIIHYRSLDACTGDGLRAPPAVLC